MSTLNTIAGAAKRGTLYGIGVGPGDVRYMTLRAVALVRSVDVIAFFAKRGHEGNARKIVAPLLNGAHRELRFEYPFTDEIAVADPAYVDAIGTFTAPRRMRLSRSSRWADRSVCWQRVTRSSTPHSCTCGTGSKPPTRSRWCRASPACRDAGRANQPITWGDDVFTVMPGTLKNPRWSSGCRTPTRR